MGNDICGRDIGGKRQDLYLRVIYGAQPNRAVHIRLPAGPLSAQFGGATCHRSRHRGVATAIAHLSPTILTCNPARPPSTPAERKPDDRPRAVANPGR